MKTENAVIVNTPEIRLNDSFFQFEIEEANINIDMRSLFSSNTYSEDAWVHITPILKSDWSPIKKIDKWLRLLNVQEYINARTNQFLKVADMRTLKYAPKNQWYKADWLTNGETPLVKTVRGRHNSGTWLHKDLFLKFITTLNVDYEIALHDMVMNLIKTAETMKISRVNTKVLFAPLTDIIKEKYIPAQPSDMRKYAYSELLDLVNLSALGMTSKAYKEKEGLSKGKIKEDGNMSIRDYMTETELGAIEAKEQELWLLIKHVSTDFDILKAKLL